MSARHRRAPRGPGPPSIGGGPRPEGRKPLAQTREPSPETPSMHAHVTPHLVVMIRSHSYRSEHIVQLSTLQAGAPVPLETVRAPNINRRDRPRRPSSDDRPRIPHTTARSETSVKRVCEVRTYTRSSACTSRGSRNLPTDKHAQRSTPSAHAA